MTEKVAESLEKLEQQSEIGVEDKSQQKSTIRPPLYRFSG